MQKCEMCNRKIEIAIFKNTGVCCELCRKLRDGEEVVDPDLDHVIQSSVESNRINLGDIK